MAAAAARYGVRTDALLVGAGADEVLDLLAKAFLPPGGAAVVPAPTYAMYRVLTEQRGARPIVVPRRTAAEGYAVDLPATRAAAREASLVWLCSPNNPTGLPEPDGAIERLLEGLAADAARDGRRPPVVVLDEAYAEFVGRSLVGLRAAYPRLVVVRTASKAYALAGMRVGFAIAEPDCSPRWSRTGPRAPSPSRRLPWSPPRCGTPTCLPPTWRASPGSASAWPTAWRASACRRDRR